MKTIVKSKKKISIAIMTCVFTAIAVCLYYI